MKINSPLLYFQKAKSSSPYGQIWHSIESSLDSGKSFVLSPKASIHLDHVIRGGYAFVTDITWALQQASKTCDLTILEEQFWPMMFAMGTQNNSAYKPVLTSV